MANSPQGESVRKELAERRIGGERAVGRRLKQAQAAGDLSRAADADGLGRYLWAVVYGMGVQSSAGAGRNQLKKTAELTMRAWPDEID